MPIQKEPTQKYKDPQIVVDDADFEGGDKSSENSNAMFLNDYQNQGLKVNYIDLAAMSDSNYTTLQMKASEKTQYQGGVLEDELTRIDRLDAKITAKFNDDKQFETLKIDGYDEIQFTEDGSPDKKSNLMLQIQEKMQDKIKKLMSDKQLIPKEYVNKKVKILNMDQ